MKKHFAESYEYDGLGFPLVLLNVPLINVRGTLVPNINFNQLQKAVLFELARKPSPFTGCEVKFIRQFMQMNFTEFANRFGVTHASVIHWEKSMDSFAKIQPTTELCIRLCILEDLHAKDRLFRNTFRDFNYAEMKTRKNRVARDHLILDLEALKSN